MELYSEFNSLTSHSNIFKDSKLDCVKLLGFFQGRSNFSMPNKPNLQFTPNLTHQDLPVFEKANDMIKDQEFLD